MSPLVTLNLPEFFYSNQKSYLKQSSENSLLIKLQQIEKNYIKKN